MIKISPILKLRLIILLYASLFIGLLSWTFFDKNATCRVLVVSEEADAISFKHGTQQQAQIVSISLTTPWQKLFLNNTGTSKIYRSDFIVFILAYFIFAGVGNYFLIHQNANPFHKTIENLLSGTFIILALYLLCRSFFFVDFYNAFIDARLPKGLQQYIPHDSNPILIFFLLPLMEIYKFMFKKGRNYKAEIDMVV